MTWETLLDSLPQGSDRTELNDFYEACKRYNRLPTASGTPAPTTDTGAPRRGRVYQIAVPGGEPVLVRVCNPGQKTSSVFRLDGTGDPYRVPNGDLAEAPEEQQSPPPADPVPGQTYRWRRPDGAEVRVRVLNKGPSKSRVLIDGQTGEGVLVPNHRLLPAHRTDRGTGGPA